MEFNPNNVTNVQSLQDNINKRSRHSTLVLDERMLYGADQKQPVHQHHHHHKKKRKGLFG